MKNENDIRNQFRTENHFTVPEGYFAQFNESFMQQLPQNETQIIQLKPKRRQWRRMAVAAASVAVVVMGTTIWFNSAEQRDKTTYSAQTQATYVQPETELEQAVDYAMLDAADMYALLVEE